MGVITIRASATTTRLPPMLARCSSLLLAMFLLTHGLMMTPSHSKARNHQCLAGVKRAALPCASSSDNHAAVAVQEEDVRAVLQPRARRASSTLAQART